MPEAQLNEGQFYTLLSIFLSKKIGEPIRSDSLCLNREEGDLWVQFQSVSGPKRCSYDKAENDIQTWLKKISKTDSANLCLSTKSNENFHQFNTAVITGVSTCAITDIHRLIRGATSPLSGCKIMTPSECPQC